MAFQLQTAKRSAAKLKLAVAGPSGSGKTMSSLLLTYGSSRTGHQKWNDAKMYVECRRDD